MVALRRRHHHRAQHPHSPIYSTTSKHDYRPTLSYPRFMGLFFLSRAQAISLGTWQFSPSNVLYYFASRMTGVPDPYCGDSSFSASIALRVLYLSGYRALQLSAFPESIVNWAIQFTLISPLFNMSSFGAPAVHPAIWSVCIRRQSVGS